MPSGLAGTAELKAAAICVGERLEFDVASPFPLKCSITPSKRRRRERSSVSGGRLDLRGARPGGGNTHSILALTQFEHGERLLQRTFRRRQVTQLREVAESGGGRGAAGTDCWTFGELSLEEWVNPSGDAEWKDMGVKGHSPIR